MESFDIAKWKKSFLTENIQEKYQVIFHEYSGEDIPYTEQFFDSESDAEDFVIANEWEEDVQDWEGAYSTRTRYYNPQQNESEFGYHIEKVTV